MDGTDETNQDALKPKKSSHAQMLAVRLADAGGMSYKKLTDLAHTGLHALAWE